MIISYCLNDLQKNVCVFFFIALVVLDKNSGVCDQYIKKRIK